MIENKAVTPVKKKHSILGIASFACALLFLLILVIGFAFSQIAPAGASPGALQITFNRIIAGFTLILNPVSILLGIIALFLKNTKKVFAILGICLSVVSGIGLIDVFVGAIIASA
jgi:hypothetical protein